MDNHRQPSLQDLGAFLVNSSRTRWLSPEEIYLLLVLPPTELGISPLKFPPPIIKDGTLCVYEDGALCKQDNISWARKKGQAKLQETYSTLKIHGAELIKAVYIRGHDNANFRRRIYKLNQPDKVVTIVHYRECPDDEKVEKTHLHAIVHFFLHRHLSPSYKAPVAAPQQPQHHDSQMAVDNGRSGDGDNDLYFDEILHDLADESAAGDPTDQQYNHDDQKMATEREMIEIIEFSPTKLNSNENERKLLVCISHALFSSQWKVVFSSEQQQIAVPIMSVLPGVIKLHVPILNNGLWKLFLINEYDEKISYDSWENFVAFSTDEPRRTLGKRPHSITSSSLQQGRHDYEDASVPSSGRYASLEAQSSFHSTGNGSIGMNDDFGRESKIRIVEKLESMKSALLGEDAAPSAFLSPHGIAPATLVRGESVAMSEVTTAGGGGGEGTDGVEWLDDTQLSTLSNSELESLMERYIMAVVKELVQLAAVDDDLKAEMDSLDANGYSLFHYCCLYNLTSLIPVLIARGVEINQATASGSTALHLAVAAGHIAVAQLLLESGVDAMKLDADGMTAYDISVTTGQEDIARLLFPLFENTAIDPSADPIQATTVTPKKRLPTLPYSAVNIGTPDGEGGYYDRDGTTTTVSTTTAAAPGSVSSQRLLHDAFATLSLTDKCALSISLSQLTPKTAGTTSAGHKSAERITGIVPSSGSRATNNSGIPPQPLTLPPPPPAAAAAASSSMATAHGFDGQRTSSDDHSSAASLSNHQDYAVMTALQDLDTSYVDMLMGDDQSTTSCSLPSTSAMFPPFPDTYSAAYTHASDGGTGFAPGDRSPGSSVSSAMGIPRATSSSSVLGFSVSSSSTSSLAAPSTSNLSSSVLHKHNTIHANGKSGGGSSSNGKRATEDLSDIQSVISESDKVSLDKAMSLMGQQELIQVEEEVRKIQNNVRGWLLRKNYVNLREAARSLQVAWREKRSRSNSAPPPLIPMATGHSPRMNGGGGGGGGGGGSLGIAAPGPSSSSALSASASVSVGNHSRSHSITLHSSSGPTGIPAVRSHLSSSPSTSGMHVSVSHPPPPPPSSSIPQDSRRNSRLHESAMDADDDDDHLHHQHQHHRHHHHQENGRDTPQEDMDRSDIEEKAAATLQAATRRMIARRSFANLHKHTMASLTIQRNLVRWWTRHSRSSSNAEPMDPNYVMTAEPSHVYVPTYYNSSSTMSGDSTNAHSAAADHAFPFPYR